MQSRSAVVNQHLEDADDRDPKFEQYQRELALVEITALRSSSTWRVGRLLLLPVRVIRRLAGRFSS
jgi:hypothetical protein